MLFFTTWLQKHTNILHYLLFCFVFFCQITEISFSELHFLKLNKIYFLLIFDHQITKAHKYLTLLYYFFLPDHRDEFFFFFLYLLFFKVSLFQKISKFYTFFFLFWKLDNWKCSHLLAHWLFKKKFHYRRSAKRGLTKKENTRENAF